MSESTTLAEAPHGGFRQTEGPGFFQRYGMVLVFLGPTLVLLGVWIVYPTIRTIIRSFYDRDGDEFIGLGATTRPCSRTTRSSPRSRTTSSGS